MTLCLTKDELADLTDYKRRDKQIQALVRMNFPYRIAPTGAIKVLRSDVLVRETREPWREEPDYGALKEAP